MTECPLAGLRLWRRPLAGLGWTVAAGLALVLASRLWLLPDAPHLHAQLAGAASLFLLLLTVLAFPRELGRQRRLWEGLLGDLAADPTRNPSSAVWALRAGRAASVACVGWACLFGYGLWHKDVLIDERRYAWDELGLPAQDGEVGLVLLLVSLAAAALLFGLSGWLRDQPRALAALLAEGKACRNARPARAARRSTLVALVGLWLGLGALGLFAVRRYMELEVYLSVPHALASGLCAVVLGTALWLFAFSLLLARTAAFQVRLAEPAGPDNGDLQFAGHGLRRSGAHAWMLARLGTGLAGAATLVTAGLDPFGDALPGIDTRLWLLGSAGCLLLALPLLAWTGYLHQYGRCLVTLAGQRERKRSAATARAEPEPETPAGFGRRSRWMAGVGLPLLFGLLLLPLASGLSHSPSRLRMLARLRLGVKDWKPWAHWLHGALFRDVLQTGLDSARLDEICADVARPGCSRDAYRIAVSIRMAGEMRRELELIAAIRPLPSEDAGYRLIRNKAISAAELESLLRAACRMGSGEHAWLARTLRIDNREVKRRAAVLSTLRVEFERAGRRDEALTALLLQAHWGNRGAFSQLVEDRKEHAQFSLAECLAEGIAEPLRLGQGYTSASLIATIREQLLAEVSHPKFSEALQELRRFPALTRLVADLARAGGDPSAQSGPGPQSD